MVEKRTLKNGVRIVYENIPYVRSVSVGIWVGNGSRYEKVSESGASHFIEHMVFKGTNTRSAAQIASVSDRIGGQINAFTTKECTCFYGRVLDTEIRTLVDILHDMLTDSRFDEDDIENERAVIFEEIDMYEDSPEDVVIERLFSGVYKNALGRPISGKKSALMKMDSRFLKDFMASHYSPKNIVIAVSGSFTLEDIDDIGARFSSFAGNSVKPRGAYYQPAFTLKHKKLEQTHLCAAFPGLTARSQNRFALTLLSNIIGGGISSRLFQNIREKRGLCYSIYTFTSSYLDTGVCGIYTATNDSSQADALRYALDEIKKITDSGVTEDELQLCKDQAKANILMGLESTGARMNRLGRNELFLGSVPTPEEMIAEYDRVTTDNLLSLARAVFNMENISFSALGNVLSEDEYKKILR